MSGNSAEYERYLRVQREHAELRTALGEMHQVLAEQMAAPQYLVDTIDSVCQHIQTHFDEEEEEEHGLFDELKRRVPRLSGQVDEIKKEHDVLLDELDRINQIAVLGEGTAEWWQRLQEAFRDFSRDLIRHEAKESELLQHAYTEDIGAGD